MTKKIFEHRTDVRLQRKLAREGKVPAQASAPPIVQSGKVVKKVETKPIEGSLTFESWTLHLAVFDKTPIRVTRNIRAVLSTFSNSCGSTVMMDVKGQSIIFKGTNVPVEVLQIIICTHRCRDLGERVRLLIANLEHKFGCEVKHSRVGPKQLRFKLPDSQILARIGLNFRLKLGIK